jgi:hypothetical protein
MERTVFKQLELNRSRTLELLAGVTEEQAMVIPNGFNNNILWNAGHILIIQERLALRLIGEPLELSDERWSLFLNGTKPSEWQATPASLAEISKLLEEQPERLRPKLQGRFQEPLTVSFKGFELLEEALIFSIGHEATHAGYIMALKKAVAAQA